MFPVGMKTVGYCSVKTTCSFLFKIITEKSVNGKSKGRDLSKMFLEIVVNCFKDTKKVVKYQIVH